MKTNWKDLLNRRLLIQSIDRTAQHPLEAVVVEVSERGMVKFVLQHPTVGTPPNAIWKKGTDFELVEVLPDDAASAHTREAVSCYDMIIALTQGETGSVTILPDNEAGTGEDNCAVEVNDDWTNFEDRRFYGPTKRMALAAAMAARAGTPKG